MLARARYPCCTTCAKLCNLLPLLRPIDPELIWNPSVATTGGAPSLPGTHTRLWEFFHAFGSALPASISQMSRIPEDTTDQPNANQTEVLTCPTTSNRSSSRGEEALVSPSGPPAAASSLKGTTKPLISWPSGPWRSKGERKKERKKKGRIKEREFARKKIARVRNRFLHVKQVGHLTRGCVGDEFGAPSCLEKHVWREVQGTSGGCLPAALPPMSIDHQQLLVPVFGLTAWVRLPWGRCRSHASRNKSVVWPGREKNSKWARAHTPRSDPIKINTVNSVWYCNN